MATRVYRGVVRHGTVVPRDSETPLAEGAEVLVTPVEGESGSGADVIAAIEASPRVPAEWVDELERIIENGRRSATGRDPFADESSERKGP